MRTTDRLATWEFLNRIEQIGDADTLPTITLGRCHYIGSAATAAQTAVPSRYPSPAERECVADAIEHDVDHATITRIREGSLPDYCQ